MRSRLLVVTLLLVTTSACASLAPPPRCRAVPVQIIWADGSFSTWTLTVCTGDPR